MIVVLLGPPGAGKGTQAAHLARRWNLAHVSTGDALRRAIAAGTDLGREVKAIVESGRLVPDETVARVVSAFLADGDAGHGGFLLDGFPRNVAQAEMLEDLVARAGLPEAFALELVVPDEEVVRRLGARKACPTHGDVGTGADCPRCGAALAVRADDAPEVIRQRLAVYHAQTSPVSAFYAQRGALLVVDGTGSPAEVSARSDAAIAGRKVPPGGQRG